MHLIFSLNSQRKIKYGIKGLIFSFTKLGMISLIRHLKICTYKPIIFHLKELHVADLRDTRD